MWRTWFSLPLILASGATAWPLQWPLTAASKTSTRSVEIGPTAQLPISSYDANSYERGWYDPRRHGGSMLDRVYEWGVHEPINVIVSNRSSPDVLRETGFVAYTRSLGFWQECASLHLGDAQYANLGDGNDDERGDGHGYLPELFEMRESWFPFVGSCLESVIGGNHFRAWKQNGTLASSGAWFLAVSKEVDVRSGHKIDVDGYNAGRDALVTTAVQAGGTRFRKRRWTTTVEWVEGLLKPGKDGINHGIAQDGRVAVLTAIEY